MQSLVAIGHAMASVGRFHVHQYSLDEGSAMVISIVHCSYLYIACRKAHNKLHVQELSALD